MSDEGTITVVEVQETQFGEKVLLDSPYESRHLIKHAPWKKYEEEVEEYGSLREKAESRGVNTKTSELFRVFDTFEMFEFSDEFAAHQSWESDALDGGGAWSVDRECWDELSDLFEFAGYEVAVSDDVNL
jgi:hypothetical protein